MTNGSPPFADDHLLAQLPDAALDRFARHLVMPTIGPKGQQALLQARVAVVGLGGIGCPVAQALAVSGVGRLTLIDDDTVSESNLSRQILYNEQHLGASKAATAASVLQTHNSLSTYQAVHVRVEDQNAASLLADHDLIIDGTDTYASRCLIASTAHSLETPLISASVIGLEGQIAAFAADPKRRYEDLFPSAPGDQATCAEVGVLSSAASLLGHSAACLAIQGLVTGDWDKLDGKCALVSSWPPSIYWVS